MNVAAFQHTGAVAVSHLFEREFLASIFGEQFSPNKVIGHIATERTGIAEHRAAHRTRDSRRPLQPAKSFGCAAPRKIRNDNPRLTPDLRLVAHFKADILRAIQHHYTAKTLIAHQHIRTAAQNVIRQVLFPDQAHRIRKFICR